MSLPVDRVVFLKLQRGPKDHLVPATNSLTIPELIFYYSQGRVRHTNNTKSWNNQM